jgi:hypothetical protein
MVMNILEWCKCIVKTDGWNDSRIEKGDNYPIRGFFNKTDSQN